MSFGAFFREKRIQSNMTLRQFCVDHSYDPGNISRLERGGLPPPQDEDKLRDYAKALRLKKDSDDYIKFMDLASAENKTFSVKHISKPAVLQRLPALFRTLDNKGLTEERLDAIIRYVEGR